jgi:GNAT superfamily N-acetyltransferase
MATTFAPLTSDSWKDLVQLLGDRGADGGCWCMFWRTSRAQFARQGNAGNRRAFKAVVDAGQIAGVIAYVDGVPVGWISVAPRESYPSLERSRKLRRVDDQPVWSIVCFFIDKAHRGQGLMPKLILAGVSFAASQGARMVEAYPTDPVVDARGPAEAYMGLLPAFQQAGFKEVARPSAGRVIVRLSIHQDS